MPHNQIQGKRSTASKTWTILLIHKYLTSHKSLSFQQRKGLKKKHFHSLKEVATMQADYAYNGVLNQSQTQNNVLVFIA